MRYMLALLLTLFTLPTFADPSRGLCMPYVECKPLAVKSTQGPLAIHVFWFIRSPSGSVWHQGFSCPLAICDLTTFTSKAQDVMVGKISPAAMRAELQGFTCDYSSFEPNSGEHPICAERKDALVQKIDEWLTGVKLQLDWKVKPNGTETTRPVRPLVEGVLQTQTIGRAPVGAPCVNNGTFLASGADRWMPYWPFNNRPVVLCELERP